MSFRGQVPTERVNAVQRRFAELQLEPGAKDFGGGLLTGVTSMGVGLFAGLGALVVATPVGGIVHEGGVGIFKKAASGVVGAGVVMGSGFAMAARQVGSGLANIPDTVKKLMEKNRSEEAAEGAEFLDDDEVREKNARSYAASRKAVEEFVCRHPAGLNVYQGTPSPKEMGLYELLRVGPTASQRDIMCAYYKAAKGEESVERRAELADACQILMDPKARETYDKEGKESLGTLPLLDAPAFFNMLFGADAFTPLVGELSVAKTATGDMSVEQLREWQGERERALAEGMLKQLEPWARGHKETFVMDSLALMLELKKEAFSDPIIICIGYTYYHMAEACLGLESELTVPAHLQAGLMLEQLRPESGDAPPDAPAFLDALWLINALDIESTIRKVVEHMIADKKLSSSQRNDIACGILRFGKIFLEG